MCQKHATEHTKNLNLEVLNLLNFGDERDFEDARRGHIASLDDPVIKNAGDGVAFNIAAYDFVKGDAPDEVNPSLWRQAKLNNLSGLFTIHPRIHQVRGYDISNMTLIEGEHGWIIIDPLLSAETAAASLALANKHLGARDVVAVIYTHSHADHFGGVRGVVEQDDVDTGKVSIIAPNGFMEYAISENVLAGNAMNRRAQYQFGTRLAPGIQGHVDCGLGKSLSQGSVGLIPPTDIIKDTGETRNIDGVEIEFQMANGSEAPAEFMFYFPQFQALCASEVTSHNMHNILTPRGAEVRNALDWSKYIDETIDLFAHRTELLFASHHWPTWGEENIQDFLVRQRDVYRFIHDETLRLVNHGYTLHEISDIIEMPEALNHDFATRGYYGTLSHNIKAVYQFYMGWWDGNPSSYHALPPAESAQRLVRAIGGAAQVIAEGRRAFEEGDYRWAAELMNKMVFADPNNQEASSLQADILEQLGYQSEAGTWRNIFLTGAQELRQGVDKTRSINTVGADMLLAMGVPLALDFLGVKFNPENAADLEIKILLEITDKGESYLLEAGNGVLGNSKNRTCPNPHVTLAITYLGFFQLLGQMATLEELVDSKSAKVTGDVQVLGQLFAALDEFDPNFNIVTP